MTYYAGRDVSLRSVSICIVDDSGAVRLESKIVADVGTLIDRLKAFSSEVRKVGFEAGTLTQYLTYGLQEAGFEVVCMEARQVAAALSAMRNKTDRNDARGIAQILRTGWYSPVHVKSRESHQVRALLSSRKAVLTKCIDLENELRGLLKSSRTVAAHFGLTPRRYQSGETDSPGHISRAGDPEVRSALYVAAHALVTRTEA